MERRKLDREYLPFLRNHEMVDVFLAIGAMQHNEVRASVKLLLSMDIAPDRTVRRIVQGLLAAAVIQGERCAEDRRLILLSIADGFAVKFYRHQEMVRRTYFA